MKRVLLNILFTVLVLSFGCDASRTADTTQTVEVTDNPAMPADTDVNTRSMEGQTAGAATSDTAFVSAAVWGNMALVKLGMMARERAINQPVQRFAIQMADRHRNTNSVLMDIAHANNWATPENLHTNQQEFYNRLETIERTKFDKAF
ncbi:MAG: DUF4142 domain-containing protein, partial [Hymenobacteraceae bacterium]|nr:DUF4142 domain-containing protein [Hymenobacteraceae bacterium]MDX5397608.1 DUF4142 domain-containing protein [Hymenobacteraceae bacterium]MDX5513688.1 DUF4142 domain-containing protein [Hymenobacteraceae bacterium]